MNDRGRDMKKEPLKSFRNLMSFRLHRLANSSQRFSEEYYRKLSGLSLVECRVIGIMSELGTATFKQVCETARIDKSFGSRVIQRLAAGGLLHKDENPSDQRSVMLSLTERGAQLQNQLYAAGRVLNLEMMSTLSEQQARVFMTCLLLISDRLDEMEQEGFEAGKADETAPVPMPAAPDETAPDKTAPDEIGAGADDAEKDVEVRLDAATARKLHQLLGRMLNDAG